MPCCVPLQLLREPFTRSPLNSSLFGNISIPWTEKTSLSRLCCCRETLGTLNGKNIFFSSRHCSPFSLAGRGEGCHYFTDESGKSSVFAVLNVSNMTCRSEFAGLNLEFGNIRKLLGKKKKRRKKVVMTYIPRYSEITVPCKSYSHQEPHYSRLFLASYHPPGIEKKSVLGSCVF